MKESATAEKDQKTSVVVVEAVGSAIDKIKKILLADSDDIVTSYDDLDEKQALKINISLDLKGTTESVKVKIGTSFTKERIARSEVFTRNSQGELPFGGEDAALDSDGSDDVSGD